ncbi:YoaK family protein [Flavobacterium sp.]|uniref:YoaK family protein n=1 Tax=Flavobacterium sp. TaxID=239 RepID=UPI002BA33FF0|nr:YoaK family protein [Flavobacterium sp.]HSD06242.1 YoaK family protein [Flavobacterium sp.]
MFRHQGSNRTSKHNLRLAILLSFVAGTVNITGVLAVNTLTTNVTGHFAFFAEETTKHNYQSAIVFLIYTLFFLAGAFVSNFLAELISKKNKNLSHLPAIAIEIAILISVGLFSMLPNFYLFEEKWIAFALLFAMGIQNALVTKISKSTVRTTHLTGLFTDLGIELSQLFFYKKTEERIALKTIIYLRLSIIFFFFLGCFMGGFIYGFLLLKTLFIAVIFLFIALYYDYIRFHLITIKRKKSILIKHKY